MKNTTLGSAFVEIEIYYSIFNNILLERNINRKMTASQQTTVMSYLLWSTFTIKPNREPSISRRFCL